MEEQEDEVPKIKINPKLVLLCAIAFAVGMIVVAMFLIISEINGAKKSCEELDMEYSFKIIQGHFCNERIFVKYNSCFQGRGCELIWVFEDSIGKVNLSEFIK